MDIWRVKMSETSGENKNEKKPLTRGGMSDIEKFTLEGLSNNNVPVEVMAETINRSPKAVITYLKKHKIQVLPAIGLSDDEKAENREIEIELESDPNWDTITQNYTYKEVRLYKHKYVAYMKQTNRDMTASERDQLNDLIIIAIKLNQHAARTKDEHDREHEVAEQLDKFYKIPMEKLDGDSVANIASLEQEMGKIRSNYVSYNKEFKELNELSFKARTAMKLAREQRVKTIENSNESWITCIKFLEQEGNTVRVGDDAEIRRIADKHWEKKLGENHTYGSGMVDKPLLNADTVKDYEDMFEERELE
jgi:hypothetical protein